MRGIDGGIVLVAIETEVESIGGEVGERAFVALAESFLGTVIPCWNGIRVNKGVETVMAAAGTALGENLGWAFGTK